MTIRSSWKSSHPHRTPGHRRATGRRPVAVAVGIVLLVTGAFWFASTPAAVAAEPTVVTIDGRTAGRTYEGVGAVFSNGMTKLLQDYPAAQRGDILRLLFEPKYGASLQHVKVEIGSDANTSAGTEPSHMRSPTDLDVTRGAGLWLAQQAKAHNPDITLEALRWGTPAWISSDADRYAFYKSFLDGARDEYGLEFDYLAPDRNEHTTSADWAPNGASRNFVVNTLRPGLDADGYAGVGLVAADSNEGWWIADRAAADPALRASLHAVNSHYTQTSTSTAQNLGLPLWNGEDLAPFRTGWVNGPIEVANRIIRSYALGQMTLYAMHPALEAAYPNTPFHTKGILVAQTPWSGHYQVADGLWVTAHFTQFAEPGWHYLDSGSAVDSRGGYVTLADPDSGNWSTVVLNNSAVPREFTLQLTGGVSASTLRVWQTTQTSQFVRQPDLPVSSGTATVTVEPHSVVSLTTTTGQRKGATTVPPAGNFPLDYTDDFNGYPVGGQPRYTSDQGGAFEIVQSGTGRALEQVLTAATRPVDWRYRETPEPYTLLGSLEWRNYEVSVDVTLPDSAGYVMVGGRINHTTKSDDPPEGYRLQLTAGGQWTLFAGFRQLATGTLAGFDPTAWHTVRLRFNGTSLTVLVGDTQLTQLVDTDFYSGHVALGSSYHRARFDNLAVRAVAGSPQSVHRYDDRDPRLVFQGTWLTQDGNYDMFARTGSASRHAGDTLEFTFNGNSVAVIGTRHPSTGQFHVYIDGNRVTDTPIDTARASREDRRALFTQSGLSSSVHTLRLEVVGNSTRHVVVDAVEVTGGPGLIDTGARSARTVVHDTFNTAADGAEATALGWRFRSSANPTDRCVVGPGPAAGRKGLVCTDTSTTGNVEVMRDFPRSSTGTVTVEWRFMQDAVGRWTRLFVSDGVDNAIEIYDTDGNGLAYLDPTGIERSLGTIAPGQWSQVRLVIDPASRTFDAYLRDQLVLSGQPYTNQAVTSIATVKFRTGNGPTVTFSLDYLAVHLE